MKQATMTLSFALTMMTTSAAMGTVIPGNEATLYDATTITEAEPVPESEDIRRFDQRNQYPEDPVAEMAELERAANDYLERTTDAPAKISTAPKSGQNIAK
jgi:hypothetical protein